MRRVHIANPANNLSRFRRRFVLLAALLLILGTGVTGVWVGATGTTWYVDDNTCPQTGSGALASPYCRIQDAICTAVAGDTVSVAPGTYYEAIRMKPGVSVVSQGGALATTINAAGKPCTDNTFCAKRTGSQCSVVTFGSGHTTTTVLDGFTITGGAGLPQTNPDKLSGGGIYVFSSPTIINNVITNNVLSGASPNNKDMRGAGVYVAVGAPVISNNTITGNRAVPPPGISGALTFGYGGGVWLSAFSEPVLNDNIIQGNQAGDPNALYSVGSGGGVVSFPGGTTLPAGHRIDRNLIADNLSDHLGGGIALLSDPNTSSPAVVTNNVIVGNISKNGGGVYQYFVQARLVNNTITGNNAFLGSGIYLGQGDVAFPVTVTNNVIEGNTLQDFGTGGGIYKWDLDSVFEPTIAYNDLWGNQRNQVAGDRSDADTIGVNGNFSADPRFVNRGARDFHLDPNSPAIDRAQAAGAPAVDKDNQGRGVDGNGLPNNPVSGDIDVGAFEFLIPCVPVAESCDGLDNNCNGLADDGLGTTTCGTGACQVTVQNCVSGVTQTCTPAAPSAETCDSIDNDCNGAVDDMGTTTCGTGTCQSTVENCVSGVMQTCTPGSPVAEQCDGLDNNCNGTADEDLGSTTCGAGACEVTVQNCVNGLIQSCTPGAPSAEVCGDGVDNDCNGLADDGFPDTDLDGLLDCTDPDDDNDLTADVSDCAPTDPTAFAAPYEVSGVDMLVGPTRVVYDVQTLGAGTVYEVVSGSLGRLAATQGFSEGFCLTSSSTGGSWTDTRPNPRVGEGWYYMVRSANVCGMGTLGSPLRDAPGSGDVCQTGVVDADGDGSPSQLDCNDADGSVAPILTETCDGLDNNCDQVADEGNPGGGVACGSNIGACTAGTTLCSGGTLSCEGAVGASAEVCDGVDNDCDSIVDNNIAADFDADGQNDCLDPDDDNDLSLDVDDCAPLDATAFALPTEVQDMDVLEGAPTPITWTSQNIGTGTMYDVASGSITVTGVIDFSTGTCLASVAGSPGLDDQPEPAPGTSWYYLVRSRNNCGAGSYGTAARDTHPACP